MSAPPLAGWAELCPTHDDAGTGVVVHDGDRAVSLINRLIAGEVREEGWVGSDAPDIYIAANGVFETGHADVESAATETFRHSVPTHDIGGYSYAANPPETCCDEPGDTSLVEVIYLTDLQIPVSVGFSYLADGIGSAESTRPLSIRAAADKE